MPISTTCTNCQATFRVPDELAGKKVKCQKCKNPFTVVKTPEATPPAKKTTSKPAEPSKTKTKPVRETAVTAKQTKKPAKATKQADPDNDLDFGTQ